MNLLYAAILSSAIGVTLGVLGGGVTTLTLPMLVYVLGVAPEPAAAASLFLACITSITGAVTHARAGRVAFRVGLVFAVAGTIGAYGGARLARLLPARVLMSIFGLEMLAASFAMVRRRELPTPREAARTLSIAKSMPLGATVGALAGLVGASGGFLVVPALETFGGLGLREAIGTTPFVTAVQSFAGLAGRAGCFELDIRLLAVLSICTMLGCLAGAVASPRISPRALRHAFAGLVFAVGVFVLAKQIPEKWIHGR
jgi:hypothetical protein